MFASNKLLAALCASPYKLTDQTLRWFLSEMFQCKRRMILPILQLVLQHAKISNMSVFLPRMCSIQVMKMLCTPKPNGFADHYPY